MDDLQARAEKTHALLLQAVRERGLWLSGDGRIGEQDAAALLGWSPQYFRQAPDRPPSYSIGGNGHRRSVRLDDLARWIESRAVFD